MHRPSITEGNAHLYAIVVVLALAGLPALVVLGSAQQQLIAQRAQSERPYSHRLASRSDGAVGVLRRLADFAGRTRDWVTGSPPLPEPTHLRPSPLVESYHGETVVDPYRHLEDPDDPRVTEWAEKQNDRAREYLSRLPGDRRIHQKLRLEDALRAQRGTASVRYGDYEFHTEWRVGKDDEIQFVTGPDGAVRVLLDPNTWSSDGSIDLVQSFVSPKGNFYAYKFTRNRRYNGQLLRIRNVETGVDLPEEFGDVWDPSWLADESGFTYSSNDGAVLLHRLGDKPDTDATLFPRPGVPERRYLQSDISSDGRWLQIRNLRDGHGDGDHYLFDLSKQELPTGEQRVQARPDQGVDDWVLEEAMARGFVPFGRGLKGTMRYVWSDGYFYIWTDWDAPNGRMFRTTPDRLDPADWTELVGEHHERTLRSFDVFDGHLVLHYVEGAASRIDVHRLDGRFVRTQELPGLGSAALQYGGPNRLRLAFESYDQPLTSYDLDVQSGALREVARQSTYFDTPKTTVVREWTALENGIRVPFFIHRPKKLKLNGKNATYIAGYGGFGVNIKLDFNTEQALWVDAGNVFVEVALPGGKELGHQHFLDGSRLNQTNTFDAMAAVARRLGELGYADPEFRTVSGGSHGGTMSMAVANRHSKDFAVALPVVGVADILRHDVEHKDFKEQYGTASNVEDYHAMRTWSPYHNVGDSLPATLAIGRDSDDIVPPWHSRKYVARAQAHAHAPDSVVLLRETEDAGHRGATSSDDRIAEQSAKLRFMARHGAGSGWRRRLTQYRLGRLNKSQREALDADR